MEFDFLTPLSTETVNFCDNLSENQLGNVVKKHTSKNFPNIAQTKISLIGVCIDKQGSISENDSDLNSIRQKLYQLYAGNWQAEIADLGDIKAGETAADTNFALKNITTKLLKTGITIIVMGGKQDLTYPLYRAFDNLDQMVNLVVIDKKFDLGDADKELSPDSYLSKIIIDEPNNLYNYSNIGYQTYYNSQEEINLLEKLLFDAYRLGETTGKLSVAEPIMRNADIVSIDMTSLKSITADNENDFEPNGFDGKEICTLTRYAGLSEKVMVLGIFNSRNLTTEANLIAQTIWYFIEGYCCRTIEYPNIEQKNFLKYIVPAEDQELEFYKSIKTQRWWMAIPLFSSKNNKTTKQTLLPCTYDDYLSSCEQNIPERWWKAQQKNIL